MNRIIASAGLVALGIAGANAAPVAAAPTDKPWSVSASLRGFYDDNYALAPNGPSKDDSFGVELNPKFGVNLNGQQTSFGASYSYTLRYFEGRDNSTPGSSNDSIDHTHEFALWLSHQFSPRYSIDLRDNLVYSEEPTLTQAGTGVIRTDGTVLHNTGSVGFTSQITRVFGIVMGYRNELYDYCDPAYSAILDRMEHYANIDLTWTVSPKTIFLTGYQFGAGNYTDEGPMPLSAGAFAGFRSDIKDFYAHYVYAGIQHNFSPKLSVSLKVGGRYTEYYNLPAVFTSPPNDLDDSTFGPYVQGSIRYAYLPNSYLELGFVHDRTATDLGALDGETSLAYATLSHSFTPKFIGTITGSAQYSEYDFVGNTSASDWLYALGLNLEYRFTPHLSANMAYNYDTVCSDVAGRSYDRNRVFMGMTASY